MDYSVTECNCPINKKALQMQGYKSEAHYNSFEFDEDGNMIESEAVLEKVLPKNWKSPSTKLGLYCLTV